MSKWIEAISHEWEMEKRAWEALLAISTDPHDIAHAKTRLLQTEAKLAKIPHSNEKWRARYSLFAKAVRDSWPAKWSGILEYAEAEGMI